MINRIKKIQNEYWQRKSQYDQEKMKLVEIKRKARESGEPDNEILLQTSFELRRLNELRQPCVQIIKDLDNLKVEGQP